MKETAEQPKKGGGCGRCCARTIVLLAVAVVALIAREAMKPAPFELVNNEGPIHGVAFAKGGALVLVSTHNALSVFELPKDAKDAVKKVASLTRGGGRLTVTPDGQSVACGDVLYDLPKLEERTRFGGTVAAFSPDGQRVAIVSSGVSICSLASSAAPVRLEGTTLPPVALSRNGRVAAGIDGVNAGVFDESGRLVARVPVQAVCGLAFDAQDRLWTAQRYGGITRFDSAPPWGRPDFKLAVACDAHFIRHVASVARFDFTKNVIAWGNDMGGAQVRSLADGSVVWTRSSAHRNGVNEIASSPDGRWLVTGSGDCKALLWRTD